MDTDYGQREDDLQTYALDPSDPLNLLLQSTDTDDSSASADSPADWSQYSSLWPSAADAHNTMPPSVGDMNAKFPDFGMDFDFSSLPDLDLTNGAMAMSMSVDPSALHFDSKAITQPAFGIPVPPQQQEQNMFAGGFPFAFSPTLSTTSISSNSTADKSPVPSEAQAQAPAAPVPGSDPNYDFTAALHAALNINPKLPIPRLMPSLAPATQTARAAGQHPALSSASSATSSPSPGPSTPPDSAGHFNASAAANAAMPSAPAPRPKTSHTTIERRYRTNLNARIQGLRQAVPALRVLDPSTANAEDAVDERGYIDGVKVARKGSKANVLGKAVEYIRVLKRREARLIREQLGLRTLIGGLPGGAPLLAAWESEWAAKYGGPERDELAYADAEEPSDDEDGDGDGDGEEDVADAPRKKVRLAPVKRERANTAVQQRRIAPSAPVAPVAGEVGAAGVVVPEKRKRGRPRKIQPGAPPPVQPAVAAGNASVMLADPAAVQQAQQQQGQGQGQPQQYLLAVFALFSFFNSPLTSSPGSHAHQQHHHAHAGSVIAHSSPGGDHTHANANANASALAQGGVTWSTAVQAVHLLASLLVVASVLLPLLPRRLRASRLARLIPFGATLHGSAAAAAAGTSAGASRAAGAVATSYESVSSADELPTPPESPVVSGSESETEVETDADADGEADAEPTDPVALALARRGQADEKAALLSALELAPGVLGAVRSAFRAADARETKASSAVDRAWARLGEVVLLGGAGNTSGATRVRVYSRLAASASASASTPSETATAALLARTLPVPFARARAERLWDAARMQARRGVVRACERLVLDTLLAGEAGAMLDTLCAREHGSHGKNTTTTTTPLDLLAVELVYERIGAHAAELFVERVMPDAVDGAGVDGVAGAADEKKNKESEEDRRREKEERDARWRTTIAAARSLGGAPRALADAFERAWTLGTLELAELVALGRPAPAPGSPAAARSGAKEDARVLLAAVVLHRRVFPRSAAAAAPSIVVEHAAKHDASEGVLSPPPTPPRGAGFTGVHVNAHANANAAKEQERAAKERERDVVRLRRVLGSGVFDYRADAPLLEDARDCVVDRLVDGERRVRGRS